MYAIRSYYGYVANTTPSPREIEGIRSIMVFAPAVAAALAAVAFYFGYRIEDEDVMRMQEDIAARRRGRNNFV